MDTPKDRNVADGQVPRGVWARLTAVSPSIEDLADRHGAALLARITLTLLGLTAWGGIQTYLVAPAPMNSTVASTLGVAFFAYAGIHVLGRTRAYRATLALTLFTQCAVTLVIAVRLKQFDEMTCSFLASWLMLSVLTGSALVPPWVIAAFGGAVAVAIVIVFCGVGGASITVVLPAMLLIVGATVIIVATKRHRDALEEIRRQELHAQNRELSELQSSLESRVEERTRELGAKNAQLSDANAVLKRNQETLLAAEKMAAIGRLTAGIAHEMSSPLSAILSASSELKALIAEYDRSTHNVEVLPADHREIAREMRSMLDLIQLASQRSSTFVRSIKAQTRMASLSTFETFDVLATIQESLHLLAHVAKASQCKVILPTTGAPVSLRGAPHRFAQAVSNLLQNAIDATAERGGGEVRVSIADTKTSLRIEVEDTGPGILPEVMPRIFEALFTTKAYGKGTGLGLSIVKEVIEGEFGGTLAVRTKLGEGSTFIIEIPRQTTNGRVSHAA